MEYLYFLIWWLIGFTAYAWSFDWNIKGVWKMGILIAILGPICIAGAIEVKNVE